MSNINLIPLKYNDLPTGDQLKLSWIQQGSALNGASTRFGKDGNLNEHVAQVQENVIIVDGNVKLISAGLDSNTSKLESIENLIGQSENVDLLAKVETNTQNITKVNQDVQGANKTIDSLITTTNTINSTIGVWESPSTIYQDVMYALELIGQPVSTDLHGNTDPSIIEATGLIKKVQDLALQVNINIDDIQNLRDRLTSYNIDQINTSLEKILETIGEVPDGSTSIFNQLDQLKQNDGELNQEIKNIKTSIGDKNVSENLTSLDTKIAIAEINISKAQSDISVIQTELSSDDGISANISQLNSTSADLVKKTDSNKTEIDNIKTVIGSDSDSTTLAGKVSILKQDSENYSSSIQDLQVIVGNDSAGLVNQVNNLESSNTELKTLTQSHTTTLSNLTSSSAKLIKTYKSLDKTISILTDASFQDLSGLIQRTLGSLNTVVTGSGNLSSIAQNSKYSQAKTANIVVVNIGTFDHINSTSASDFESSLTDLLTDLSSISGTVYLTTGFYVNSNEYTLRNYILSLADRFNFQVIDTYKQLGVNSVNVANLTQSNLMTPAHLTRYLDLVGSQIQ